MSVTLRCKFPKKKGIIIIKKGNRNMEEIKKEHQENKSRARSREQSDLSRDCLTKSQLPAHDRIAFLLILSLTQSFPRNCNEYVS